MKTGVSIQLYNVTWAASHLHPSERGELVNKSKQETQPAPEDRKAMTCMEGESVPTRTSSFH